MAKKQKNKNSEAEELKSGKESFDSENEFETSDPEIGEDAAEDSKEESAAPAPTKTEEEKKKPNGTPRFIKLNQK